MGMIKNYLLNLLQQCSEESFGQDAIEWAIMSGLVRLTYNLDQDIRECMSRYDEIIEAYRKYRHSLVETTRKPAVQPAPMQRASRSRAQQDRPTSQPAKKRRAA